jgi:hypothetical protein
MDAWHHEHSFTMVERDSVEPHPTMMQCVRPSARRSLAPPGVYVLYSWFPLWWTFVEVIPLLWSSVAAVLL